MTHAEDLESIVVAAHALTRIAAIETRNDAPAAQWRALSLLLSEGPLRIGELARLTRTTQPGMTRLAGRLQEHGLVTRSTDPADSRVTVVAVTDTGAAAYAAWRVQLRDALEPMFEGLSEQDWDALRRAARILASRTAPVEAT